MFYCYLFLLEMCFEKSNKNTYICTHIYKLFNSRENSDQTNCGELNLSFHKTKTTNAFRCAAPTPSRSSSCLPVLL